MFVSFLIFSLLVWFVVVFINYIFTRKIKLYHFHFSERNYYLMMSWVILGLIFTVLITHSITSVITFLLFGIAGVMGETFFSIWWHSFFAKRFWVYEVDTWFNAYTSFLNFIPWGLGGLLYLEITKLVIPIDRVTLLLRNVDVLLTITIILLGGLLIQRFLFYYIRRNIHERKFHTVTVLSYLFFILPFLVLFLYMSLLDSHFFLLTLLFGIIATLAEYLYGKATEVFISKKMWIYTYVSFDKGHFTPLSIPAFMVGGFYFLLVGTFITLLVK